MPAGAKLLGWIDHHPAGRGSLGYAVLRMRTGVEVAWDGQCIRSLPRNWRDRCTFESAEFRQSVIRAMQARGMTQQQLATLAGIPQQNISRYLTGARELRTDRLERIAAALGLALQSYKL